MVVVAAVTVVAVVVGFAASVVAGAAKPNPVVVGVVAAGADVDTVRNNDVDT